MNTNYTFDILCVIECFVSAILCYILFEDSINGDSAFDLLKRTRRPATVTVGSIPARIDFFSTYITIYNVSKGKKQFSKCFKFPLATCLPDVEYSVGLKK